MKIENYSLDLHAKHAETTNVSMSFIDELHTQNSKKSERIESVKDELEFMKRLQYELVNELLSRLQPATCRCLPKDFSTKEFISQDMPEFATRTLSITKEYTRSESLDVSMSGCIKTATEQIKIDMNLSFSSTFTQTNSIDKTIFYDPLILSFDGELPNLDTQTFDFDIDMDGESDQISKLKKGSGFLALDKNNNGAIDDGYELFGTQNGNGFIDLKRYDNDANGWIDENDSIFDSLRIWNKTKDEDTLVAIGEVGIGAIYLGYAEGDFDIKDESKTLGRIKSNGLFLNEDGTSGLVTQIDFAKQKPKEVNNSSPLGEILQA